MVAEGSAGLPYWLWYSMQEQEHQSNSLTIMHDGTTQAMIEYSEPGFAIRRLGAHNLEIGEQDADLLELRRIIRTQNLVGGDQYGGPALFGALLVTFQFEDGGEQMMHTFDPNAPLPPGFADVETIVERLFERLRGAPLRALEMTARSTPPRLRSGDELRVSLDFSAHGRFSTSFRNPVPLAEASGGHLRLNLWQEGSDPSDREFAGIIDLEGREFLLAERKAVTSQKDVLQLAPGEQLSMYADLRLPQLEPGKYVIEAIYFGEPVQPAELETHGDLIAGELHADLISLVVDGD